MKDPNSSSLRSRRQVAALFNISVRTLLRWEADGLLKPLRLSNRAVRYEQREVERFLASSRTA